MKKLLLRILLILLPVVGYFVVFFIFEPYNYLGFKETANTNSVIYRTRAYVQQPTDSILVGDSRLAHLDMELVQQLTGEQYANLCFGGASVTEAMDLYEFALKTNPEVKNVILSLSFYTLNTSYYKDRTEQIEKVVSNPLAYMTNFDYNLEMLNEIRLNLRGERSGVSMEQGDWAEQDYLDEDGNPLPYRQNLMDYAQLIMGESEGYTLNNNAVDRVIDIAKECEEKGINFTVVLPPAHESITEMVIKPLGIDTEMQQVLDRLEQQGVAVLDYEQNKLVEYDQDMYYDGFHLDPVTGLDIFTTRLFTEDLNNVEE